MRAVFNLHSRGVTESLITNINSGYITPDKAIELINQIHEITKSQPVPPDQLPDYIKKMLEAKQKIDEEILQADALLQTKNVKVKAINDYIKLSQIPKMLEQR